MINNRNELSKVSALRWILFTELIGFILIILSCWLTELYDPPFNLRQVLIETSAIVLISSFTIYWRLQFIKRIKYLEGFMVVCASCKRVKEIDGKWVSIEHIISSKSELEFSHGVCPECVKKLYGVYL
jgi:hypothetical protein